MDWYYSSNEPPEDNEVENRGKRGLGSSGSAALYAQCGFHRRDAFKSSDRDEATPPPQNSSLNTPSWVSSCVSFRHRDIFFLTFNLIFLPFLSILNNVWVMGHSWKCWTAPCSPTIRHRVSVFTSERFGFPPPVQPGEHPGVLIPQSD